jgi:phosphoenolpyruvate carboxylase
VDLSIWRLYLEKSDLLKNEINKIFQEFFDEYIRTIKFVQEISGESKLLWHRPWLETSINYRSSMIHPLNILQLLALKNHDNSLLRETVTGIACGMLTTG